MTSKTAVVVGANGGAGIAVTRALLAKNYAVWATVSRPEKIADFRSHLPGCRDYIALDLAKADELKAHFSRWLAEIGRVDAVIVCGAVAPFAPAEFTSFDAFRQTMEINCVSNLALYQSSLPFLRETRGRLVLTGSYSGKVATPMMASYVASKFALEGLVDVMRQEAGAWGVEVVLLQPGSIETPMVYRSQATLAQAIENLPSQEASLYGKLYRQMKYRADSAIEARTFTPAQAVADAALHAIEAAVPETRYPVGSDAENLVALSRSKSDREIDELILEIYRSAPV